MSLLKKAMKKVKTGDYSHLLKDNLMGQMSDALPPRERLHVKLKSMKNGRLNAISKALIHEKEQNAIKERIERRKKERAERKEKAIKQKRAHKKRIKALSEKYGKISHAEYNNVLTRLSDENTKYSNPNDRAHDKNILDVFEYQNQMNNIDIDSLL